MATPGIKNEQTLKCCNSVNDQNIELNLGVTVAEKHPVHSLPVDHAHIYLEGLTKTVTNLS